MSSLTLATILSLILCVVLIAVVLCIVEGVQSEDEDDEEVEDIPVPEDPLHGMGCLVGNVYRDLDPRRKNRFIRVLDVFVEHDGDRQVLVASVLSSNRETLSHIKVHRLTDPSLFEQIPVLGEV